MSLSSLAYRIMTALRKVFDAEYAAEIGPVSAPGAAWREREPTLIRYTLNRNSTTSPSAIT